MKKVFIVLFSAASLFSSCTDSKAFKLPENAEALIHGDSVKTWKIARRYNGSVRMNMGPCFMAYRQSFYMDSKVSDNNSENPDCGQSLVGKWELKESKKGTPYIKLSSPQLPELLNTEKEYKNFRILKLTEDTLKISFKHTQYGNTSRTITDVLVREDLDIGDRYFHH